MLKIEFLYYDKATCERCTLTNKSIKRTLKELKDAINNSGWKIEVKEKKLPESKIHLSPTILINGKDIERIVNKNSRLNSSFCSGCCQLVGRPVNCRTFTYNGKTYDYIPKEMILEAIKITADTKRTADAKRKDRTSKRQNKNR